MSRTDRIMSGVAAWCGYYRNNPHRFVKDYLHLDLKLFQKFLINMMNVCVSFCFIACRGLGKTFLCAVFCVIRCILYPGTKIVIASGTRGQSINVLEKIMLELRPRSRELSAEIDDKNTKMNGTNAVLAFKNGSFIKVVTAGDSARGSRANILLIDEFRLVSKDIVDTILRKFLTNPRMPEYSELSEAERKAEYDKERNKTLYLSSAWWSDSWAYTKCLDNFKFMLDDNRKDFVCGFPYQLAIKEGLLRREDVEDQMSESDFSEVKWAMEMGAEFFGSGEDAFFDFSSISKNRRIKYPMMTDKMAQKLGNSQLVKIPPKQNGEIRVLSADIALMSSKKNHNDATSIFINQMLPTKSGRYTCNIVYVDAYEGMRTDDQALVIRKLFDEFNCDYIALDCQGLGLGVADCLMKDINDPDTGEIYPAISCCNDKTMAERCASPSADRVIWSIKANAQFNSDCAFLLREGFRSGKIRLLVSEYDAEEALGEIRGYGSLSTAEKTNLQLPYIHTTLLIDELVKLQHDESSGKVRIYERSGMRKDRYSSLSYNFYVATQLESKMNRRNSFNAQNEKEEFVFRAPQNIITRRAVDMSYGKHGKGSWQ